MSAVSSRVESRLEQFSQLCRRHAIKATHQRFEIYRELLATDEHPDAKTVYLRVRKRVPTVSFDTVYRALRLLEEKGMIARVRSLGDSARFDANPEQHHHFVCIRCGAIHDFTSQALDDFRTPREAAAFGEVHSAQVELRGICANCREKKRRRG